MRKNGPFALAFHTLVILFVLAPLAIVVLVAFTPDETLTLPTHGVSLRWFRAILDYPDFVTAFVNSVKLAFASATLSLAIALPAGLAIGRATFPGRAFLNGLLLSPLVIPGLVLGIALLRFFALIGATGSFAWLVLAHMIVITPFVMRLVLASVAGLDRFDLDGALRAATRAATLAPDNALALNNTSLALKEARRRDEAEQYAALAVERAPHSATYRHNLSLLELARGDYASGWVNYESRWEGSAELRGNLPAFSGPRWRGESLKGKTLLVWGEQGLGDALQFCRYVPQLAERVHREGGRIVWNAFPVMGALLERSVARHVDVFDTSTRIEDLPAFDFELPLMSVPGMLGLDGNTIATTVPYLHADPAATDAWRTALASEKRLKVGLAWTGNLTHPRNRFRRVGLERFAEAFGGLQQNVAFYSLQPGAQHDIEAARSNGFVVTDTTREWKTLDDTAAFIGALDLVITVCTSAAHLSGALGQFTWVLLDANPHWVWQHDRRDSAFYPSVSLYRQKTFADWQPVLDEATADLRDLVG
ncbi:hypothetical protein SB461_19715 [Burkholderia cenocepacia]|nr:hypothetical protein [Burkholderia cenocepacia]MEB2608729.1 hypothetical protein [Burkholderia cenocepacia]